MYVDLATDLLPTTTTSTRFDVAEKDMRDTIQDIRDTIPIIHPAVPSSMIDLLVY